MYFQLLILVVIIASSAGADPVLRLDDSDGPLPKQVAIASPPSKQLQFMPMEEMMNRFNNAHHLRGMKEDKNDEPLPSQFIINGETAQRGRYPWFAQAYTRVNGGFYLGGCGAVLVAPDFVMTAAHCVDGQIQPTHFEIGTYCPPPYSYQNCNERREFGKVIKRYLHEDWGISASGGPVNDIALFQLEDKITSTEPIGMNDGSLSLEHGDYLTAIGVGVTNQNTGQSASKLQEVEMRYVSNTECKTLFQNNFDPPTMICALNDNEIMGGTCSGDSGGPIFSVDPDVLVGITSFGSIRCAGLFPDVYTSTSGMFEWAKEKICPASLDPPTWCSIASTGTNDACSDDLDASYLHNSDSSRPERTCKWLKERDADRREKICKEKPQARVVCLDTCDGKCSNKN
mmetsp:Transcript_22538/g.48933  ORF Transcript_22538/g.48933 Transcript_22538/m.48933 type:complete len:400 (+) Transcript_22538:30-1229(+)